MQLTLNIYTDETLKEVERTVKVDSLKIPYRTTKLIIGSLKGSDLKNTNEVIESVLGLDDELDTIIKATFGIDDEELFRVNFTELGSVAMSLYNWAIDKVKGLAVGDTAKNA